MLSKRPSPSEAKRQALVKALLDAGLVSDAQVARAELVAARSGEPVEQALNQMGVLSDDQLANAYVAVTGCGPWNAAEALPDPTVETLAVTVEFLKRHRILPLSLHDGRLVVATCDPLNDEGLAGLVFATGCPVDIQVAPSSEWRRVFAERYSEIPDPGDEPISLRLERELDRLSDASSDSAGAQVVSSTFESAVARGASDVHIEPRRHDVRLRLRLDGSMIPVGSVSLDVGAAAIARIKVLADLDLGEKRLPQDGRATLVVQGRPVEVRVSVVPTAFGESAVLRILDRSHTRLDLASLGFEGENADQMQRASQARHGIFLVTGPTGSGKTTTLYALLNALSGADRKILSIEDPIEYHFEHVIQTQVAPSIGLTFANTLRAFLRQDPDVLLVGEIRDAETAAVAVQAAMTGHLVLASVHANDALRVIPRLIDMGVEPYQLGAAFLGSAAQRLARRLCQACKAPAPLSEAEAAYVAACGESPAGTFHAAKGCAACGGAGVRGRLALSEVLMADETFLRTVARGADQQALAEQAGALGLRPMAVDGIAKARLGQVSVAEVMSVLGAP